VRKFHKEGLAGEPGLYTDLPEKESFLNARPVAKDGPGASRGGKELDPVAQELNHGWCGKGAKVKNKKYRPNPKIGKKQKIVGKNLRRTKDL